jgi:hypothetical protein
MKMGAPRHFALDLPTQPPEQFQWQMNVFWQLHQTRTYTQSHMPRPFTNQEVLAWCQLNDETLSALDLFLLRYIDATWINTRTEFDHEMRNE